MHRIISLIASSTEIVCALGLENQLVGRSHECDFPPTVLSLSECSEANFDLKGTSLQIDQRVRSTIENALSVYKVHSEKLEQLQPTIIITQDQCEVCAVSLKDVEAAVCKMVSSQPQIVSLAPNSLRDVIQTFRTIADALDVPEAGEILASRTIEQITAIQATASNLKHNPSVVCVEWIEPFMAAGNWVPELVEIAGGNELIGIANKHTPYLPLEELAAADPDKIIVMPCGWGLEKTRLEMEIALQNESWRNLRAVESGELYLTDGNHFFNRPSPRIVESLQILTEILHPDHFNFGHHKSSWERY